MSRQRLACWLLAPALLLGATGAAIPGDLRIEPVSLSLRPGESSGTLSIANGGDMPLQAQVRVFAWSQQAGGEVLEPTPDLAASPPVLDVPAQGRQLIRLVRLKRPDPMRETAYRVIVDELPGSPSARLAGTALLRYSIPVFAVPEGAGAGYQLAARVEVQADGSRMLRIDNRGDRHVRLTDLAFIGTAGREHVIAPNLAGYVLAGRHKHWPIPPEAGAPPYGRFQALADGRPVVLVPAAELAANP